MTSAPLERIYDLADAPAAGYETPVVASAEERRRLAEWAGVDDISRLEGRIAVRPQSRTRFMLETDFEADIVQSCVVTLEPVHARIARSFARTLLLLPGAHRFADRGGLVTSASVDDDAPEEIDSTRYDLAGPLREEFALAIDPYPRASGVAFQPLAEDEKPANKPFGVLKKLQRPG